MEWYPMKSAPKDGTHILVEFDNDVGVQAVQWCETANGDFKVWCIDDLKFGPYALRKYNKALRWTFLPVPPK